MTSEPTRVSQMGFDGQLHFAETVGYTMTGIQFVTDSKGRKVAVQINLRKHGAIWEDFYDGLISEKRRKEKGIPLETVKRDLVKRGRLRG
jgi:hypothetical protein